MTFTPTRPRENFLWLLEEPAPRHLVQALKWHGLKEIEGKRHNPVIMAWARALGVDWIFTADEIPWCGLFVGWCMAQAGRPIPANFFRARDWLTWDHGMMAGGGPMLGDVLIFSRKGGGHVGFYVGENKEWYWVLGGNQGNEVSIAALPKDHLMGVQRPRYKLTPPNIRQVYVAKAGQIEGALS